ncbi:MAG: aminotransferase class V-fold PLP-dependent enzyme [Candidatus Promineifilaceae bacterium]
MGIDDLKELFLLDPDVVFLNHGSFGATPRAVFDVYQAWQARLERQPVQFLANELPGHLAQARAAMGSLVGATADDLVLVPNATFGLNVVARSLVLGHGDELLTSDHEYGACMNMWTYLSKRRGFQVVRQPLPLPLGGEDAVLEQFWQGVTPRTRAIFLSHITSPTAVRLPVAAICARARDAGILAIIDGAHTPGQIDLDMAGIGADFYAGNGHKWLCSPKGSAFLYARASVQPLIEPLVVGWGWGPERSFTYGSDFLDRLQWLGTNDLSAFLALPAAIQFQADQNWPAVRARCHELLAGALERISDLTGLPSMYSSPDDFVQMAIAPLPPLADAAALKAALYDQFRVEVPLTPWGGRHFMRLSVQGYNSAADIDVLYQALITLLPVHAA